MLFFTLSLLFCLGCLFTVGFNLQHRDERKLVSSPAFNHRYSLVGLVRLIIFPPHDFGVEPSEKN